MTEPSMPLTDAEWSARFAARIVERWKKFPPLDPATLDDPDEYLLTEADAAEYGQSTSSAYLPDRAEYETPEEAADTDISYWGQ